MTITTAGHAFVADQLGRRTLLPPTLMAIGTGTPGASALGTEISRHQVTPTSSGSGSSYAAHWDIDDQIAASITEVGLFSGSGTMIASQSFSAVGKGINDPFNVTWGFSF